LKEGNESKEFKGENEKSAFYEETIYDNFSKQLLISFTLLFS